MRQSKTVTYVLAPGIARGAKKPPNATYCPGLGEITNSDTSEKEQAAYEAEHCKCKCKHDRQQLAPKVVTERLPIKQQVDKTERRLSAVECKMVQSDTGATPVNLQQHKGKVSEGLCGQTFMQLCSVGQIAV